MSQRTTPSPPYKVGELARIAGVSVRTLHHYEDIGLLVPSGRSESGHRIYDHAELARLTSIIALAKLGLSLEEIRQTLDERAFTPLELVERHLERARAVLEEQAALCERLEALRGLLMEQRISAIDGLIETLEVMKMYEKYYTKEQLEWLEQRRQALGDDFIRQTEQEWTQLFAQLRDHMQKGTDPGHPDVQALVDKSEELLRRFTGGDPGIESSLARMYAEQPVEKIHSSLDSTVFDYLNKARSSRAGGGV